MHEEKLKLNEDAAVGKERDGGSQEMVFYSADKSVSFRKSDHSAQVFFSQINFKRKLKNGYNGTFDFQTLKHQHV